MDNPAAWHPDPAGKHDHRWWDGQRWTEHVADAGVASVDPLPAAPDDAPGATASTDVGGDASDAAGGDASDAAGTAGATPDAQQPAWGQQPQQDPAPWEGQQHGQAAWQSQQPHGQQPHGQQPWGGAPAAAPQWNQDPVWGAGGGQPASNGLAIGALVTGILSLPFLFAFGLGGLLGIVAVVLGIVAIRRANRGDGTGRGMAIGGLVTGSISIIIAIFVVIFLFAFGSGVIDEMDACMQETGGDAQECQRRLERELTERFTS